MKNTKSIMKPTIYHHGVWNYSQNNLPSSLYILLEILKKKVKKK